MTQTTLRLRRAFLKVLRRALLGDLLDRQEAQMTLTGELLAMQRREKRQIDSLSDVEFKVFSQYGEDGIIDWLIHRASPIPPSFIEIGVQSYKEANTRFLLRSKNWRGVVVDASTVDIDTIKGDDVSWRHSLHAEPSFVTRENVNEIILRTGMVGDIGLLSIDIDGNDYWIWEAVEAVSPAIVVVEYNTALGDMLPISMPYKHDFDRTQAHPSWMYFGASVRAFDHLAERKGYVAIGSGSNGVNAFYLRKDIFGRMADAISQRVSWPTLARESRNTDGSLSFMGGSKRSELIESMPVVNVATGQELPLPPSSKLFSAAWRDRCGEAAAST